MIGSIEVLAPGPLTTVQDLGRPGHADWGVSPSGAADRGAARLANRLVGNPEDAGCLEITLGGLRLRVDRAVEVAITGAAAPATLDGQPVGHDAPFRIGPGQVLAFGTPSSGLRTYLAVRGGVDVPTVLGSRATDVLGGLGPAALRGGDRLPIGNLVDHQPPVEQAPVRPPTGGTAELRVVIGPRDDRFTIPALDRLLHEPWAARSDSNRVGVRLDGPALQRAGPDELPTEGLVRGAIQVPPSGPPTLFLADHPVTGGYPVIAVVLDADADHAAQVRPGQQVRFRSVAGPVAGDRGAG
ncbi:MAG: biotin-dependent carboxyltransferase family protein [Nitriliruptor sp.]|uniref:biotin-dependent carboxyltransferase family protein n=1 Tax=Nitriliruptor sp. TaxID=2448056 RepID=UPI0034A0325F